MDPSQFTAAGIRAGILDDDKDGIPGDVGIFLCWD